MIFGAEGKGHARGAVSSKVTLRERDFGLGNACLAKTNAVDKTVVCCLGFLFLFLGCFFFKSRLEFLAEKGEKNHIPE